MEPGWSRRSKEREASSRLSEDLSSHHSPEITRNIITWNLHILNKSGMKHSAVANFINPWSHGWSKHLGSKERGVPIATVCNNCDTRIKNVLDHYFQYETKRANDGLATDRGQLKGTTGTEWMRSPYFHDS